MILELRNIELSFTDSRSEVLNLLKGIDLQVSGHKVMALVGGNGSGKTTLFNIISGFQREYKGEVMFDGRRIDRMPAHKRARLGIGRMFQGRQLIGDLTLLENMKLADENPLGENPLSAIFLPHKIAQEERAREQEAVGILQKLFGKENKYLAMLDHKAANFSYGEQRLLALACLLMNDNHRLLLLDEPTAGVNPTYTETISRIIRRMVESEGMTVLMIEHNMHFVRNVADECAYLDDGVIRKVGTVTEVLDDAEVRNSYLGL